MENKIGVNLLLDHYGGLLTPKQQEICRYYYRDDLSCQEIAEIEKISRAAVYDTIKRCRDDLKHYEDVLKIQHTSQKRMQYYHKIKDLSKDEQVEILVDKCIDTETEGGSYE
jgi:predicted DNA-binding protein YlxM (UPF0122 family)